MCLCLCWPFTDCELSVGECFRFLAFEGYTDNLPPALFTTGPISSIYPGQLKRFCLHFFLSHAPPTFPIPCFTTSCIPLSFWTWDIVTPTPWEMGRGLKIKRKTISSTDGLVWGNEIACLIVACNGEQFEVNWGEIGHWATVCPSIVVRHKVYQRENHWTPKKSNSLSDLTNENYLALTDEIARSIVIVIKFLFFSSVPESGSWAWNTWQCPIHS